MVTTSKLIESYEILQNQIEDSCPDSLINSIFGVQNRQKIVDVDYIFHVTLKKEVENCNHLFKK